MAIEITKHRIIYSQEIIRSLFDSISNKYDLLNRILSFGIDVLWRKRAIKLIVQLQPKQILDVCTGTGDFAIEAASIDNVKIIGVDISLNMLNIAKHKISKLKLDDKITFRYGEAENLDYPSNSFDIVMCAFGVRNFSNLQKGLSEFHRILKDNGVALILEFSKTNNFLIKHLYTFYSNYIIPFVGRVISKNNFAYRYLPKTVSEFPCGYEFSSILEQFGFKNIKIYPQTFGIATIYTAEKRTI